jgi:putative ATP-dependent endonuclease of OLD family
MRIARLTIQNFRGIESGEVLFPGHCVLVGDNNSGKSTILEAIDLVLGPERLAKRPPIDEHDFFVGRYLDENGEPVKIQIQATVIDLSNEQARHFRDHIEWWSNATVSILAGPPPEGTDATDVVPALRVGFSGRYDPEEDDFFGSTYFLSPQTEDGSVISFNAQDKRLCGFLFLRTLRTGSRALSLERGSLLDIILRLQEKRLQMWEDVLRELRQIAVAANPELGISSTLAEVQAALKTIVPADWATNPQIRVSDLTRENLRHALTVFMGTGAHTPDGTEYAAPFNHQGTGTINTLVLALLSMIAELKQNVIFAMEEPEIALPPHTQKRIVDSVRAKSAQVLFTSHSPYVLEEFEPSHVLVLQREAGRLTFANAAFPPTVKPKNYRTEFRTRFSEALLAKRVLITEGRTEYDALPAAARRLSELHANECKTLECMGIAIFNAETDSQIAALGQHFSNLGKLVFAVFDKQADGCRSAIAAAVAHPFESPEKGLENVIIKTTGEQALRRHALSVVAAGDWPQHLGACSPTAAMPIDDLREALSQYFKWAKGSGSIADLLGQCAREEMPSFIVETLASIQRIADPSPAAAEASQRG